MKRAETGRRGESYVKARLINEGYEILFCNYHSRYGEIDIIAKKGEMLAFVEVKTRGQNAIAMPCESVGRGKQQKIILTAQAFLLEHPCALQPRFDVAEVVVKKSDSFEIAAYRYIENAFGV